MTRLGISVTIKMYLKKKFFRVTVCISQFKQLGKFEKIQARHTSKRCICTLPISTHKSFVMLKGTLFL